MASDLRDESVFTSSTICLTMPRSTLIRAGAISDGRPYRDHQPSYREARRGKRMYNRAILESEEKEISSEWVTDLSSTRQTKSCCSDLRVALRMKRSLRFIRLLEYNGLRPVLALALGTTPLLPSFLCPLNLCARWHDREHPCRSLLSILTISLCRARVLPGSDRGASSR